MIPNDPIHDTATHLFRHESGKMLAVLVRLFGLPQVEVAEDIVQETLVAALETWRLSGLPDNPRAWLYRAAKNRTIDYLRRERNFRTVVSPNAALEAARMSAPDHWLDSFFLDSEIEDAQLRMMFACCHPAIGADTQLILMLRTLGGLHNRDVAAALLLPDDTVAKRLFRAKEKIRDEQLALEVPQGAELAVRLDSVLQAVYLLFSEGYKSTSDEAVIRRDLCEESLRLGGILVRCAVTNQPKTHALQSLMCFQAARLHTRMDTEGRIVLLENQDRSRWHQGLIALGYEHLQQASVGQALSEYHLEAAIASYHASAVSFEATNWQGIFYCYDLLVKMSPTPFAAFNRAIALGYARGPQAGLDALDLITELDRYHLFHVARGDFFKQKKDKHAALLAYQTALRWVALPAERQVIEQKMADWEGKNEA
jgi:RNA polymerase sigma factor (sigma-70 family)